MTNPYQLCVPEPPPPSTQWAFLIHPISLHSTKANRLRTPVSTANAVSLSVSPDQCLILILVDPQNWNWPEGIRGRWVPAVEPWQNFYKKWREATDCATLMGPSPSLSVSPSNMNDLPDIPNTLYVRRFYEELFKLVWKSAFSREKGHLIIGQPGIGKYHPLLFAHTGGLLSI